MGESKGDQKGMKRGTQERKVKKKIQQKYFTGIYICLSVAQIEKVYTFIYTAN